MDATNRTVGSRQATWFGRFLGGGTALLTGAVGAVLFWLLHMPLPWMLGAMAATAVAAVIGAPWSVSRQARDVARPVIGVLAGSAFTPELVGHAGDWPGMLLVVLSIGVVSTLSGFTIARRAFGFDRTTAFFASTPAGLTEMSLMGDSLGGDIRSLFLIHAIRVVAVVFTVPLIIQIVTDTDLSGIVATESEDAAVELVDWLLLILCGIGGGLLARLIRIPAGSMIYSLVLSAILHSAGLTEAAPPAWLVVAVQVIIGCAVGARFRGIRWTDMTKVVIFGVIWAALILTASIAVAFVFARLSGDTFASVLLAIAPGGMVEMTLVTYALGVDVALIVACQVLRNVSTMIFAPAIFHLLSR